MLMQVDVAGFERELGSQKKRSREAVKSIDLTAGRLLGELAGQLGASNFIGYEHGSLRSEASVLALLRDGKTVDSASAGDKPTL
jgi:alanyl-tRNA synthetase